MGKFYNAGVRNPTVIFGFGDGITLPVSALSLDKAMITSKTIEKHEYKTGVNGNSIGFTKQNSMSDFSVSLLKYDDAVKAVLAKIETESQKGAFEVSVTSIMNPTADALAQTTGVRTETRAGFKGYETSEVTSDGEDESSITLNFTDLSNSPSELFLKTVQ